jgi:hypothetical protein
LAPSSSELWDRVALGGIALGLALYVAPFWSEGRLKLAFWITFAATVLHVITSHAGSSPTHGDRA